MPVCGSYGEPLRREQALPSVYFIGGIIGRIDEGRAAMVVGVAIAMFVALFAWGAQYFGWQDPEGRVQLALFTSFILGIIGGYKAKGD